MYSVNSDYFLSRRFGAPLFTRSNHGERYGDQQWTNDHKFAAKRQVARPFRRRAGQKAIAGESVFGHRLSSTGLTPPAKVPLPMAWIKDASKRGRSTTCRHGTVHRASQQ
jgi:hypothetical protein